ncbi:TrkH family potassium uptake protein [Sporosarcina sp. NPDC096371]|uniref:TrkH family potassium uptake protein n=1 Tax=Sporosarcina sp. NPDC096371 TaxID=3364530 RepID=UPI003817777D
MARFFALLIILGTLLFKLPFATTQPITWTNALFTATSATTVTGLSVFEIGTTLTLFGQIVLLILVQVGEIGLMTFAVAILIIVGKKVGFQNSVHMQDTFNEQTMGDMVKLVKQIILFVLIAEGLTICILSIYWAPDFGWRTGIYYSIFHVISTFNNAGFSLFPENLIRFSEDPVVLFILSSLLIVGGIGFVVVTDIFSKKSFRQWSLHTKMLVGGTLLLNGLATLILFALEYHNTHTIGEFPIAKKLLHSYFQAVSSRTAGFNAIPIGEMEDSSLLFIMFLMFIGGGSTSTASGIKLTTFIIVIFTTIHYIKGIPEPRFFGKAIKTDVLFRSLAITIVSMIVAFGALFLLNTFEHFPLLPLAVEVFSAFGTVGLSMGITGELSDDGKGLLCIVMFIGRLGPLTLFYLLLKKRKKTYHFPYEQVRTD